MMCIPSVLKWLLENLNPDFASKLVPQMFGKGCDWLIGKLGACGIIYFFFKKTSAHIQYFDFIANFGDAFVSQLKSIPNFLLNFNFLIFLCTSWLHILKFKETIFIYVCIE